jgi:hypothetical protein
VKPVENFFHILIDGVRGGSLVIHVRGGLGSAAEVVQVEHVTTTTDKTVLSYGFLTKHDDYETKSHIFRQSDFVRIFIQLLNLSFIFFIFYFYIFEFLR